MIDVLLYLVIIMAVAFMVYQTHRFVIQLQLAHKQGRKKDVYIFSTVLIIIWVLYIGAVIYVLLAK